MSRAFLVCSLALAVVIVASTIGVVTATSVELGAPTRATIMARAQNWVDRKIPYCQCSGGPPTECCGHCPYCNTRCDCSGYVSFCWGYSTGYTTESLPEVAHQISKDELLKGDIMLYRTVHVVIFGGWTDGSKTHYVALQEPGCHTAGPHYAFSSVVPYPFNWEANNFVPYRKNSLGNAPQHGDGAFATPEEIRAALAHTQSYPLKYEGNILHNQHAYLNYTLGLKLKFGVA